MLVCQLEHLYHGVEHLCCCRTLPWCGAKSTHARVGSKVVLDASKHVLERARNKCTRTALDKLYYPALTLYGDGALVITARRRNVVWRAADDQEWDGTESCHYTALTIIGDKRIVITAWRRLVVRRGSGSILRHAGDKKKPRPRHCLGRGIRIGWAMKSESLRQVVVG